MSDTLICPRVIWKVDLSFLNPNSRSYCQSLHILKSYWRVVFELSDESEEYKIYIMPENPELYMNARFLIQCGLRDVYGTLRFERFQTTSTDNLFKCCIWRAARRLLLNDNLIQNNVLWIVCTVEPESSWEDCQIFANSSTASNFCTSLTCTDSLISDLKYLRKNSFHHDVVLECDGRIIKAHRSVLSCRSNMFEGMFRTGTKEALEGKAVIHDTPFCIFEKLIHYMYTTEINLENINFACEIYVAADKFLIQALKERCRNFFKANLRVTFSSGDLGFRVSDACKVLCLADEHADIHLQSWTEGYLADTTLLVTPEWNKFVETEPAAAIEVYFRLLRKVDFGTSSIF